MYPIGFGYRGFVHLPALARFEKLKLSIPTSVSVPPAAPSTITDTFATPNTVTVTETTTYTTTAFLISSTSAKALSGDMIYGRG